MSFYCALILYIQGTKKEDPHGPSLYLSIT